MNKCSVYYARYRLRLIDLDASLIELRYNRNHDPKTGRFTSGKGVDKSGKSDIIKEKAETAEKDVHTVGKINIEKFSSAINSKIQTDEVIITDERIRHIKERHPNDYELYFSYIKESIEDPDYIIEANKPNSAVILKEISENGKQFKTILRLLTVSDNAGYKNSVITFMKINNTEWKRLIKNKKILYKSE